jgi:hypothetical protein
MFFKRNEKTMTSLEPIFAPEMFKVYE